MENNSKLFEGKKILVLGAHPDDVELGCGGAIAKLIEEGQEVFYIVFSKCEKSIPEGFPKNILEEEVKKAAGKLGIKKENIKVLSYPVRDFPQYRQDILEDLVKLRKEINPDIIFLPSSYDFHQDHITIYEEGLRAFNQRTILGYELPWTNRFFGYSAFMALDEKYLEIKIEAIKNYASQSKRKYMNSEFIKGWANMRGMQSNTKYAEAFETIQLKL
ncbi:MAG: PIG-L deacetylase family protein [Candidatus Nealsonbacteria bacterium]